MARDLIRCFFVFMCGVVVAINLSVLLETNPNYEAAWWKVGFAGLFALGLSLSRLDRPRL